MSFRDVEKREVCHANDMLFRVWPALHYFNQNSKKFAMLGSRVSMDEGMGGTKCRVHGLLRLVKGKPTPEGFRFWLICDASTGYLGHVLVDEGNEVFEAYRRGLVPANWPRRSQKGRIHQGEAVVMLLIDEMRGQLAEGTHFFFDRYFTTVRLIR